MKKNIPLRLWRDEGILNRFFRVLLYVGAASFAAFWLISVWLEGMASIQPDVATGLFQHPYAYKGRIGFLTDDQALVAHIGNVLAYGWGLAVVAAIWLHYHKQRADQAQTYMLRAEKKKFPELSASAFSTLLHGIRDTFPARVQLESPLSPDDCLDRLRIGLQMERGHISGVVSETRLIARKAISYRNSFQTVMSASIYKMNGRTFIQCNSSMPLFASIFLTFWFGAIGLVFIVSVESLLGRSFVKWVSSSGPWEATFFCAMLLAAGIAILVFGRVMATGEQEFLLSFIRDRTNATVVGDDSD